MRLSPLFWPVSLKNNVIYILDETALPGKVRYIKVKNYRQSCLAIKQMNTRAVGQVLLVLYTFLLVIRENKPQKKLIKKLNKISRAINALRPTLPFRFLTDMILGWADTGAPLEKSICGFLEMLKDKRIQQAKEASKLLGPSDTILTHCNLSGLLPLIAEFCRRQNKRVSFFVTETRPYLQGARLTAWELKKASLPVTIIADNMVAQVMYEGIIDKVIVGADHLARNGDIANKIGTYQIAILARHFKIPFYVLCPPASYAKTGRDIKIEIRPQRELLEFAGKRIAPEAVRGYYPAFDITPRSLITKHIPLKVF
jgi:methylthioribose-1-phosphate isomerase